MTLSTSPPQLVLCSDPEDDQTDPPGRLGILWPKFWPLDTQGAGFLDGHSGTPTGPHTTGSPAPLGRLLTPLESKEGP